MKELFQPLWNIYMQNQKLETELAYKSAKCYTLRHVELLQTPRNIYTLSMASFL